MIEKERTPFFQTDDNIFRQSSDMLAAGFALLLVGTYINGITAVLHTVICCASAVLCELLGFKLVLKKNTLGDLNALATGLLISLLLPSCAPLWLGAMASAFAVLAVKLPFGGAKSVPFVPVCAGICFAALCFPEQMFTYASAASRGMFASNEAFVSGTTLIDLLNSGKSITLNVFGRIALLSGTYPGAIGTTAMLIMPAVALYILIRDPKRLLVSAGYILSCAIFAMIFPRVNSGALSSAVLELSAGSLMFTALLLVNDPVTSPKGNCYRLLYGVLAGIICMLLRRFAKMEDPCCLGVIIVNALWPAIVRQEKAGNKKKNSKIRKRDDKK